VAALVRRFRSFIHERVYFRVHDFDRVGARAPGVLVFADSLFQTLRKSCGVLRPV